MATNAVLVAISTLLLSKVLTERVTFKNVTLWTSSTEQIATVPSSNDLKETLPEDFTPSIIVRGKIPILYEDSVSGIDSVKEIFFHDNEIEDIETGALKNLTSVKTLVINCSNLTRIKQGIFDDLTLEQLQVSYNLVSTIDRTAFQKLPNLKRLILWHNNLTILNGSVFDNLKTLEVLDLSNNAISNFPKDVFKNLPNIKMILLKWNKFESVPSEALDHLSIQYLDLTGNLLKTLPDSLLNNLPKLSGIILSHNHLESISEEVFRKKNVTDVDLYNNTISFIAPGAFNDMPKLSNINLSNNKITNYDVNWFENSSNIYRLFFSYNLINQIPDDAFRNVYNDNHMWIKLDGNKIQNISQRSFRGVKKLDYLDLSYNGIEDWDANFLGDVEKIHYLNLFHNNIKCVKEDFDEVFKANFTYLGGNPLTETCVKRIDDWKSKHKNNVCTSDPCFSY